MDDMELHLCDEDDVLGYQDELLGRCPHPDVDDDGFCLTCDRRVKR